jgi:hypothetical protein
MGARSVLFFFLTLFTLFALGAREGTGADSPVLVTLTSITPFAAGQTWEAAPPRFVLLEDGQVFVGGSKDVLTGHLDKAEVKALLAPLDTVRKLPGLASVVSFGANEPAFRLRAPKGKPLDIRVTGGTDKAPAAFRPLAAYLEQLSRFEHPSLRPYSPASYQLRAREGTRPGGCRLWTFAQTPAQAAAGVTIPAASVETWVGGVYPTSVCVGERRYEVMLRPLVPGDPVE